MKLYTYQLHVHEIGVMVLAILCAIIIAYLIGEHHGRTNQK